MLLAFMFKHGRAAAACQLLFPPAPGLAAVTNNDTNGYAGAPVTTRQAALAPWTLNPWKSICQTYEVAIHKTSLLPQLAAVLCKNICNSCLAPADRLFILGLSLRTALPLIHIYIICWTSLGTPVYT